MATDIVDDRFFAALHLRAMRLAGIAHDSAREHDAFRTGTLETLLAGRLQGDATIDAVLEQGDHGIGSTAQPRGELIIVDGEAYGAAADGRASRVAADTTIPFAVVCRFSVLAHSPLRRPLGLRTLRDVVDAMAPGAPSVLAVRLDGDFTELRLAGAPAPTSISPPLGDAAAQQTEWSLPRASGTVVGFRFPDRVAGVEVPSYHLHFLADDRTHGGHVIDLTMSEGELRVDGRDELHVELPEHLRIGTPRLEDRAATPSTEGG